MTRLGILLSGRGSNFVAIAEAIRAGRLSGTEIGVVLTNREEARGVQTARELGIPALTVPSKGRSRVEHDQDMVAQLKRHGADLICLAGYMRLLSGMFVQAFPGRILNIHPSLLPSFPGLDAQRQALEYGAKVSGCTVHLVDEELDHGAIILQRAVDVDDTDTPESLTARILEQEHIAYSEAIRRVVSGEYELRGRRYVPRSSGRS